MVRRLLVLAGIFVAGTILVEGATRPESIPIREPLGSMPFAIGRWSGQDAPRMPDSVLAELGADDYVNRVYFRADRVPVFLYIGYYQSQRQGDAIHSPMNCLPGAGWQPATTAVLQIPVAPNAPPISAKRVLIENGLDRQVVLYWYQSHGRSVASDYWSKLLLIYDAVRLNRSDAALVRVISPVLAGETSDQDAERRTIDFVRTLFPELHDYLPS
jgi:EpsI family protein